MNAASASVTYIHLNVASNTMLQPCNHSKQQPTATLRASRRVLSSLFAQKKPKGPETTSVRHHNCGQNKIICLRKFK